MVRFFLVLWPYPGYGVAILALVTALGVISIELNPAELDSGLGLILLVQMFLVSGGFLPTARRGQFDPVLGCGANRTAALAAQWLASMLPGAIAWLLVGGTAWIGGGPGPSALAGTRVCAFLIVSSVGWSAGFTLPRGGAGALWMGILALLLLRHPDLLVPLAVQSTPLGIARTAGAVFICPFLLLGTHGQVSNAAVGAATAAAAALLLATWRYGARADVYLVEHS